jgi:DedD protein
MEKKKLLLVAVSVGVFLVIVISAAILIFTPRAAETGTALSAVRPIPAGAPGTQLPGEQPPAQIQPAGAEQIQPATMDAADMVRNAGGIQGIQSPPPATDVQENRLYISENSGGGESAGNNSGDTSRVVINVPKPSTAAVPDTPAAAAGRSAPRQTAPASRPAAGAAPVKPSVPAAIAAPKPAARPAAAPLKTYSDYWVQTGAFTAKIRAEGVKETLSSKGITSIIENRELDGKTWYRVRVGPYTSENEANYWLALVKSIEGFGDSQVRVTQSRR